MYEIKNYDDLKGIDGFSETLLNNHFSLYAGYVTNTNKLIDLLKTKEVGTPEYAELHRRFGWEWNGMRLHELYFENLTKQASQIPTDLKTAIESSFGSFENWQKDFVGIGTMRGIGWVVLAKDSLSGNLFNVWINEHDGGHLAGVTPLLVMDVFEHSYMVDYGIKKIDYVNVFMKSIDWKIVDTRSKQ